MHIKNKWCIIILIWSIICMTKAMLIYSCNIYTHIDIWVIYVYVCLWGTEIIWEVQWKHRTTLWQNEFWWFFFFFFFLKHTSFKKSVLTTEVWIKWCFVFTHLKFWFSFLLSDSRGKESCWLRQSSCLSLSLIFFFYVCFSALFVFLSLWLWKWRGAEAQLILVLSSASLSRHPSSSSPSPLPDDSRYSCLYWVDRSSTTVEQCSVVGSVLSGSSWHWRAPLHPVFRFLRHKKSS